MGLATIALFLGLLTGCTTRILLGKKVYLTKDKAISQFEWTVDKYGRLKIFELNVDQLSQLRSAKTLTYLGTESGYHFMRVWNHLSYPEEINFTAVKQDSCTVEDRKTLSEEMNYQPENYGYHPWRPVILSDKKCFVRKWAKGEKETNSRD